MTSDGMWVRFKAQSSHQINVLLEICVLFFICFFFVYVTDLVLIVNRWKPDQQHSADHTWFY